MAQVLTVVVPDQFDRDETAQYVTHIALEVEGGITSEHTAPDYRWTLSSEKDTASGAPAEVPAQVWLAVNLFPESMEVMVAADRDGALEAIKATIDATEWQNYQDSLARNGEPGADLTLEAPAHDVITHYWGEFEDASEHGAGAVFIDEYWLVRPAPVGSKIRQRAGA